VGVKELVDFVEELVTAVVVGVQKYLFSQTGWAQSISWIDYGPGFIWLLGPLLGCGDLLGDAIESFLKRQRGTAPGNPWFPFDQIDYIIGGLLFSLPIVRLAGTQYLAVFAVWFGMHLVTVFVFYHIGIRDKPI
jgi:hypothetical protein